MSGGQEAEASAVAERPPVPKSIEEAETSIRRQNFETAHVWGADGIYLFGRNGDPAGITHPADEWPLIKDALYMHNHPTGTAFSNEDVHFIEDLDPAEFRAIGPATQFILRRPAGGWPTNLHAVWFANVKTIYGRLQKDVDRGKLTKDNRSRRVLLEALRRTVIQLGLDFTEDK